MADWQIERLDKSHQRGEFHCSKPALDDFLRTLVSQYERRNLGRTYIAVVKGQKPVQGYYTLASGAVSFQNLPEQAARKLPRHPVPVVLLARLAVDQDAQGKGLGEALLVDALRRCLTLADAVGVHAVEVDAIDEHARAFYEKYGFTPLLDGTFHLYLPIATVREALGVK
jgi:GNAT superfamily N-acetyltransferase